ncbi:MAG: phytanoyl-CoA dioxygenase family protein [Rhodospirillales bacterium]|nr:phytanoyl-CoA dioxygenase family protein [Rhodospirillales bacterium]MBN8907857.1 phytanoyl-CoA dioxygenase family protein [Rhodospirillales bacterium]
MPRRLTEAQVRHYHEQGYCEAVPVLTPAEVARFRAELEAYEAQVGHPLGWPEKSKSYLLFDWADKIVHHPKVLDVVEDVIGPDILVYHSTTWIKEAGSSSYTLWHQDGPYFYLDPPLHVTAWVALSDATVEAGCVHVLPSSHKLGPLEHVDLPGPDNMIKRGQGVPGYDHEPGVPLPVMAGEVSLHHTNLLHTSRGNASKDRRIGLGISYIPTSVRPTGRSKPSALLVRGVNRFNHFLLEQRLQKAMSEEAFAAHAEANARFRALQDSGFAAA